MESLVEAEPELGSEAESDRSMTTCCCCLAAAAAEASIRVLDADLAPADCFVAWFT